MDEQALLDAQVANDRNDAALAHETERWFDSFLTLSPTGAHGGEAGGA